MATRYVSHLGSNTSPYDTWAKAATTLATAVGAGSAGDVYYVAHDHAANYGSNTTMTFQGTAATPDRVMCVNRAGSVPPVAADLTTGAIEGTNAASTSITLNGTVFMRGMTFAPGSGQSTTCNLNMNSSGRVQNYHLCAFRLLSTGASSVISPVSDALGRTKFTSCTLKFAATGQTLSPSVGEFICVGNPAASLLEAGGTTPTNLLKNNSMPSTQFIGCDLSDMSGTLIAALGSAFSRVRLTNCKLHATAVLAATPSALPARAEMFGCHSTTNVRRDEMIDYLGALTTETTIKRTDGASDGTTAFCWKIVTTANSERDYPFQTFEGAEWNEATGSALTLTVHTVTDNVTLTDAEIWLEADYLGAAGAPISTRASDANATVLTAAANQASDSGEAWTTTGLTTPIKQKLEVTFTPAMIGLVRWRVCVAKASTTVYVCPKATLA